MASRPSFTRDQRIVNFCEKWQVELGALRRGSSLRQVAWLATHPRDVLYLLRRVLQLPRITLTIPKDCVHHNLLRTYDAHRPLRIRGLALGLLSLPEDLDEYFRGTARQNLRTRSASCRRLAYTARFAAGSPTYDVVRAVCNARNWPEFNESDFLRIAQFAPQEASLVAAYDEHGNAVAFCLGLVVGDIFLLKWALTSQKGNARWFCFDALVREVHARDLRYILDEPQCFMARSALTFQVDLGFVATNVRTKRTTKRGGPKTTSLS